MQDSQWSVDVVEEIESDRATRCIKEALNIRKEGDKPMNRDEDSYTRRYVCDGFNSQHLAVVKSRSIELNNYSLEGIRRSPKR